MPDENVSRVPFGRTRKIDTGTCWPRRAAVGDVEIAVAIEDRVVHLMQPGGERRRDLDERRLAGAAGVIAHRARCRRRGPAGTMTPSRVGRRERRGAPADRRCARPAGAVRDGNLAVDVDAAAFDRRMRIDCRDAASGSRKSEVEVEADDER